MDIMGEKEEAAREQGEYKVGDRHPPREHQFKPGQSGNPKGCPVGTKHFTTLLYKYANSKISEEEVIASLGKRFGEENVSRFTMYFAKLDQLACSGDPIAIKTMLSFLVNMPKQELDHTTGGDKINKPTVTYDFSKTDPDKLREILSSLSSSKVIDKEE